MIHSIDSVFSLRESSKLREVGSIFDDLSLAFVATYPPKKCGIATFTRNLTSYLKKLGCSIEIVALDSAMNEHRYGEDVSFVIEKNNRKSYFEAADYLNESDVELVMLEHEYGLFGGDTGEFVLNLMNALTKPTITTLHTVIPSPPLAMKKIVKSLTVFSQALVVMARKAVEILEEDYGVPSDRISFIPHGCPDAPFVESNSIKDQLGLEDRIILSTFGLLGPGKGLEHVISALPRLAKEAPEILYVIIGETHPEVKRATGEEYREKLRDLAENLGVEEHVRFVNRYLSEGELVKYLQATDIYITPYTNSGQIVSGTLTYALGVGNAIVSTPYLYAKELLGSERGVLCNFKDPRSISLSLRMLLENEDLRRRKAIRAYRYGRNLIWPKVASEYIKIFNHCLATETAIYQEPVLVEPGLSSIKYSRSGMR